MSENKFTISEWRRLKNISQEKLAEICGVHINTIRYWEQKPSIIKIVDAEKLAEAFGVTLENIIFLP